MSEDPIRILIVDDHAVVRKGLAMVLRLEPEFEVVGETGDGNEAIELVKQLHPDVILLDRVMPKMDGKTVAATIKKQFPNIRILILTGTEIDKEVMDILAVGVDGYVLKEIEPAELKRAIFNISHGEAYLHPMVTRKVLDELSSRPKEIHTAPLTPREREVLNFMATNAPYREIGERLFISEETVRSHAKSILGKLNQKNRGNAVKEALRLGLIQPVS